MEIALYMDWLAALVTTLGSTALFVAIPIGIANLRDARRLRQLAEAA